MDHEKRLKVKLAVAFANFVDKVIGDKIDQAFLTDLSGSAANWRWGLCSGTATVSQDKISIFDGGELVYTISKLARQLKKRTFLVFHYHGKVSRRQSQ